jgi:hypothetical protein
MGRDRKPHMFPSLIAGIHHVSQFRLWEQFN